MAIVTPGSSVNARDPGPAELGLLTPQSMSKPFFLLFQNSFKTDCPRFDAAYSVLVSEDEVVPFMVDAKLM